MSYLIMTIESCVSIAIVAYVTMMYECVEILSLARPYDVYIDFPT